MIDAPEQFWFDEDAAANAVEFFTDCLVHVQGPLAGKPFTLLPWQLEIVSDLFGWKESGTGFRQYTDAYIEIPRKNGKTTFLAGIGLYLLLKGETGGQIYGCAGSLDQAALLYDIAAAMVAKSPLLRRKFTVLKSKKRIVYEDKNAYYRAIPAEPDKAHGSRPTAVLFDELHKQKNRDLWDAMKTGMGSSFDSLFVSITTAGNDRSTICWEQHVYAEKVRDGDISDPHFYPVLYGAADNEPWDDPDVWERANPSLGISVPMRFLDKECKRAKEIISYENTFRNLYLNQWTEQSVRWLPMREWDACARDLDDEELMGRPCWAGLDLAATRDVTSLALCFELPDDVYAIRSWNWAPEKPKDTRAHQDRTQVRNWQEQGVIGKHPGDTIEYKLLAEQVCGILERFDVECVAVDPSGNAEAVIQMMCQDHHWPLDRVEKFGQNYQNYSPAMNDFERRIALRKLVHDGNPALRWMAGNVAVKQDGDGKIKPDKEASGDKIDGIVAAFMALSVAIHGQTSGSLLVI